jgi:hypothetical protein
MRSSPRNRSQQISSSGHGLTLVGMLSLDLPAIVSVIFVVGAIVPASLVLTLGYLPFGLFNAAFGRGNMDRLVFEGAEIPLLVIGAGTILLLAAPTFYWRIQHFRRILLSTTTVPGQIRSLNFTPLEFSVDLRVLVPAASLRRPQCHPPQLAAGKAGESTARLGHHSPGRRLSPGGFDCLGTLFPR